MLMLTVLRYWGATLVCFRTPFFSFIFNEYCHKLCFDYKLNLFVDQLFSKSPVQCEHGAGV